MKLLFFATRWGYEQIPWSQFLRDVKAAGYNGVEAALPTDRREQDTMLNELAKQDLQFIGVHWDTVTADYTKHTAELESRLQDLVAAKPRFITSHTGKDFYSFEQNARLLNLAQDIATQSGIQIVHETHRGKFSFAAHITKQYLEELPWLQLTLDISHWFTVAESFLQDQEKAVQLALSRTEHIHCRVGFTQGPQVTNPRAPECAKALEHHVNLWDKVITARTKEERNQFTFTTEFGPVPYMPTIPYKNEPVSNQWEINTWMMNTLRERY